jgi:peptidoglycan hydrolase-like protein with peptidoglycan-binding domain
MNGKRAAVAGLAVAGLVAGGTAVALPAAADTKTYYEGYGPHRVLQQGAKGNEVLALQWILNCRGYHTAKKPPGHFGPTTYQQVRNYQISGHAEEADGKVGAATWHFLYDDGKGIAYKNKPANDCVKGVQVLLNKWPKGGALKVDGKFGSKTQQKVKSFQKRMGRPQTGQVDARTFHQLVYAKAAG